METHAFSLAIHGREAEPMRDRSVCSTIVTSGERKDNNHPKGKRGRLIISDFVIVKEAATGQGQPGLLCLSQYWASPS